MVKTRGKAKADELQVSLVQAVLAQDAAGVRQAVAEGADIDALVDPPSLRGSVLAGKRTPLMWACGRSPLAEAETGMASLLLELGANIDAVDESGLTALHRLVYQRSPWNWEQIVLFLLEHGAAVRTRSRSHATPLESACRNGSVEVAGWLLEHGAEITPGSRREAQTWPDVAKLLESWPILSAKLDDDERALLLAARRGDIDEVRSLLGRGASPDALDTEGASPVDHAMSRGHVAVARLLCGESLQRMGSSKAAKALLLAALQDAPDRITEALDRGAKLSCKNRHGKNALMLAARFGCERALTTLLDAGAKVDEATSGKTALVEACSAQQQGAVQVLLHRGANADRRTRRRNLALETAVLRQDPDIVRWLLRYGADVSKGPALERLLAQAKDREVTRLLREAQEGRLPPDPEPRFGSHQECELCGSIPDHVGWCRAGPDWKLEGESIPTQAARLEIFPGYPEVRKCPLCHTYYLYEHDHDGALMDGYDSEDLRRLSLDGARELLQQKSKSQRGPSLRVMREIEVIEARKKREASDSAVRVDLESHLDAKATAGDDHDERIDINQAPVEALVGIPGIGTKIAARIVAYRKENGNFRAVADLTRISGIGSHTMATLERYVRIEPH